MLKSIKKKKQGALGIPKGVKVVPGPKSAARRAELTGPDIRESGGANTIFRAGNQGK
jgi:hypothetical protein